MDAIAGDVDYAQLAKLAVVGDAPEKAKRYDAATCIGYAQAAVEGTSYVSAP